MERQPTAGQRLLPLSGKTGPRPAGAGGAVCLVARGASRSSSHLTTGAQRCSAVRYGVDGERGPQSLPAPRGCGLPRHRVAARWAAGGCGTRRDARRAGAASRVQGGVRLHRRRQPAAGGWARSCTRTSRPSAPCWTGATQCCGKSAAYRCLDVGCSGRAGAAGGLDDPAWSQPVIYALECALTALLSSVGVRPDVVVGHGPGEISASQAAGVFSLEDGLRAGCTAWRTDGIQACRMAWETALDGTAVAAPSIPLVSSLTEEPGDRSRSRVEPESRFPRGGCRSIRGRAPASRSRGWFAGESRRRGRSARLPVPAPPSLDRTPGGG